MRNLIVITIVAAILPVVGEAQRPAERNLLHNPLWDERHHVEDDEQQFFNSYGGWGGFGNFGLQRDTHHLWHQDLGAFIELWRRGDSQSLIFTGQIEFIADAHNDINFNPRAIFWEEGFMYTVRRDERFLQFGFYHRCKHDIDNLDLGEERSLIYSSLWGRWLQPFSLFDHQDLILSFRYDRHVITWDNRIIRDDERQPDPDDSNWDDLRGAFSVNAHWQSSPGQTGQGFYLEPRGWLIEIGSELRFNYGVNAGINFRTAGAEFRLGLEYEYLHDSGIPAEPSDVHLISIGFKATTPQGIR